jgi:heme-degrading monooxygenase HmoA
MYARVVTAHFEPEKADEIVQMWREFVAPSASQQAGFQGARLFLDRESGEVLSMGLWESRAHFEATVEWNQGQIGQFAALISGTQVRGYDLVAEALPAQS